MDTIGVKFAFGAALGGMTPEALEDRFSKRCAAAALRLVSASSETEGHGWLELPEADISDVKETAEWLRSYDSVVHVGIGGSALGNLMLNQALLDEFHNEQSRDERGGVPRFYLADNPDPTKALSIWERVKNGRVALVGVSKSGATAETMSQFLWFREMLTREFHDIDVNRDTLVVTDPEKGIFRAFAKESGCRSLALPPSVGGRYSVLSSAGLVSAAALGIDIDGLLAGAEQMKRLLLAETSFAKNPALLAAALSVLHENKRPMAVLMPYSSKLEYFAEWFAQLWGESLGKKGKGTTPVRALGAVDQHSQVQLYTEGPDDKFYTLINVRRHGKDVTIPCASEEALRALSYMGDAEIGEMLKLEAVSTAAALTKAGRPVVWIELDKIDAPVIGALVFYYEYMTALTGGVMEINPFDQPGVEQGKRYTYGLMGRDGYGKDAEEAESCFSVVAKHIVEL